MKPSLVGTQRLRAQSLALRHSETKQGRHSGGFDPESFRDPDVVDAGIAEAQCERVSIGQVVLASNHRADTRQQRGTAS